MSQFLLPDLGEGLEDAQVVQWLVAVGDRVALNQPIVQVETAKAMVDLPSPFAGIVQQLHANPGDTVPVGAPLITIAAASDSSKTEGGSGAVLVGSPTKDAPYGTYEMRASEPSGAFLVGYGTEGPAQTFTRRRRVGAASATSGHGNAGQSNSSDASAATGLATSVQPADDPHPSAPGAASALSAQTVSSSAPSASPLVRKMAAERGIDLSTVRGTGPGGRIRVEDLDAASPLAAHGEGLGVRSPDEERISTVGLRKAIAARMMRAATTIPHFTEYSLFDASALVALRERLKADPAYAGAKLTFLPFFVRALVKAVQAYPILNSRWDEEGNAIVVKKSIHVGIATDTARGLLVPVIHNAHTLDLARIAAECERLVALARDGKADVRSLSGSTITITNVGAAGPVDTGAPLINPPEACVVGFGAIKPRPTVVGDALAVRPGCWISISCDHRIVDGAAAAQFMGALVDALEHPDRLAG